MNILCFSTELAQGVDHVMAPLYTHNWTRGAEEEEEEGNWTVLFHTDRLKSHQKMQGVGFGGWDSKSPRDASILSMCLWSCFCEWSRDGVPWSVHDDQRADEQDDQSDDHDHGP